jgi:putative membrane protein
MYYELVRFLHFAAIFALAGALIVENMALKPEINAEDARNLAKVDAVYGVSAALVFLFGLTLWLWVGKPSAFYSANPLFQIKLGLFILLAILSIYPALFFIQHRRAETDAIRVPNAVAVLIKIELLLLLFIPVLAFLMARGIGLST